MSILQSFETDVEWRQVAESSRTGLDRQCAKPAVRSGQRRSAALDIQAAAIRQHSLRSERVVVALYDGNELGSEVEYAVKLGNH